MSVRITLVILYDRIVELNLEIWLRVSHVRHRRVLRRNRRRVGVIEIVDDRKAVDRLDLVGKLVVISRRDRADTVERDARFKTDEDLWDRSSLGVVRRVELLFILLRQGRSGSQRALPPVDLS